MVSNVDNSLDKPTSATTIDRMFASVLSERQNRIPLRESYKLRFLSFICSPIDHIVPGFAEDDLVLPNGFSEDVDGELAASKSVTPRVGQCYRFGSPDRISAVCLVCVDPVKVNEHRRKQSLSNSAQPIAGSTCRLTTRASQAFQPSTKVGSQLRSRAIINRLHSFAVTSILSRSSCFTQSYIRSASGDGVACEIRRRIDEEMW